MSESKWTSGPWHLEETKGSDGERSYTIRGGGWIVAFNVDFEDNANLIAAAPDLAEALWLLLDAVEYKRTHGILEDAMTAARSALSRAKGETNV